MNTKTLHTTSLGRIYMMLRADLVSTKRTIITLMLSLITLVYFLPRLMILTDLNIQAFMESWVRIYNLGVVEWVMMTATLIYFWVYVNRRIVHSQPTLFSTLPAKLWEKLVSIALYAVVLSILYQMAVRIEFLMEYLTVPAMPWKEEFAKINFVPMFPAELLNIMLTSGWKSDNISEASWVIWGLNFTAVLGLWCFLQISLFTAMTHIRNAFVALFAHFICSLQWSSLFIFIVTLIFSRTMIDNGEIDQQTTSFLLLFNAYLWGTVALLVYFCRRKLQRLPS